MKYYQVIFVDEYNNFYELGYYAHLEDAEPDVNNYLESYILPEEDDVDPGAVPCFGENENLGHLVEYAGTFDYCFDRTICVEEGVVQVRGFIKDTKDTINSMKELEGEKN